MNRRGFAGAALAGLGGLLFPRKKSDSIQCSVSVDVDEDRLREICKTANIPHKFTTAEEVKRSTLRLVENHLGLINRWYPGVIKIDVQSV